MLFVSRYSALYLEEVSTHCHIVMLLQCYALALPYGNTKALRSMLRHACSEWLNFTGTLL